MPASTFEQLNVALWNRGMAEPPALRTALQVEYYSREDPKRVPKGTPEGGQFAKKDGDESHDPTNVVSANAKDTPERRTESDLRSEKEKAVSAASTAAPTNRELFSKPPVPIITTEHQFHGDFNAARVWALFNLRKEPLHNDDTGIDVQVGYKAIHKATSMSAFSKTGNPDHLEAIALLPKLMKAAILAESHADRDNNENIRRILRFYVPVQIGDTLYRAKLTVKEYASKDQKPGFYTHELTEIEMPARKQVNNVNDVKSTPHAGTVSVHDLLHGVKRNDGTLFIDPFDENIHKKEDYSLADAFRLEYIRRDPERYRWNAGAHPEFKEDLHPRQGKGRDNGGQFAAKGSGGNGGASESSSSASPSPSPKASKTPTWGIVGGKRVEIQERNGQLVARPEGATWAPWSKLDPQAAKEVQQQHESRQSEREANAQREQAYANHHRLELNKSDVLTALQSGPINGNRLWRSMGIPKDDFLDAFFALAEAGEIHQNPKNGILALGQAPEELPKQAKPKQVSPKPQKPSPRSLKPQQPWQPISREKWIQDTTEQLTKHLQRAFWEQPQPKLVERPKRTPEEEAAAEKARQEAESAKITRELESKLEVKRAEREEQTQRLNEVADEHGVNPDHLLEAAQWIAGEKKKEFHERETAKGYARELTKLTAGDIQRLENAGMDYTSAVSGVTGERLRGFDEKAQEFARHHPGMIGDPDDPSADFSRGLWDLIREGKQEAPNAFDPDILREAVSYVQDSGETAEREPGLDDEAIPFRKPGSPERYARFQQWKTERYRRMFAECYGKASRAATEFFTWTEEDEEKHPRDEDGKFASKGFDIESIKDTRDYVEHGERFIPVGGSGDSRSCDRCGQPHEVHYHVRCRATGKTAVVGSGCAFAYGIADKDQHQSMVSTAKTAARLRHELSHAEFQFDSMTKAWHEIQALPTPAIHNGKTEKSSTPTWTMGDAVVWDPTGKGDDISPERKDALLSAWRDKRMNERGYSVSKMTMIASGIKDLQERLRKAYAKLASMIQTANKSQSQEIGK